MLRPLGFHFPVAFLQRAKPLARILIPVSLTLLATVLPVYAALSIKTTYLYDLQGPTKDSHFNRQSDVFCDIENNEVYVVDTGNHCVRVFGKEGIQIFQFGQNGVLTTPLGIVVNSRGDMLVLQSASGSRAIDVFDFKGKHISRLELEGLPEGETCRPDDMAIDSRDNLYLSDPGQGCIYAFDAEGRFRFKILPGMSEKDREEVVFGNLMVDKDDRLFLPVSTLGMVIVYDSEGKAVMNFGIKGGGPGKLAFPIDVAVDKHGHFLVLDKMRHCLSVYDRDGRYLTEFGGMGTRPGWFYYPSSLEIDRYGRIYVSQRLGNKVQVLKVKEEFE
jgi:sugar lactone lactonase YvrE